MAPDSVPRAAVSAGAGARAGVSLHGEPLCELRSGAPGLPASGKRTCGAFPDVPDRSLFRRRNEPGDPGGNGGVPSGSGTLSAGRDLRLK